MRGSTFGLESRIIKDEQQIIQYDNESNLDFFIPKSESSNLDWELINEDVYEKSRTEIGELDYVYVAVNPDDPLKNDISEYRIHLRILDGRHKYHTGKRTGKNWPHQYVFVKDFLEFDFLRSHFGTGKSQQKQAQETKMIIDQRCNYYYDVLGIESHEIGAMVVNDFKNTRFSQPTIYRHINPKFLSKKGRPKKSIKLSKKDKKIITLENEIDSLNRQLFTIKERNESLEKENQELKSRLQIRIN